MHLSRKYDGIIAQWLTRERRKPLIIRGARQVGKSTLVRTLAQTAGLELVEVNLERHLELDAIFAGLDTSRIRAELEAVTGKRIEPGSSLLFLDEIQATPHAIHALRYFHEDVPELPVIAAGSLLEFVLSDHAFPMPVGRVEYLQLGPLTFKDFLGAVEPDLLRWLDAIGTDSESIPTQAHSRLLAAQRAYMFVGGMPEAVAAYAETKSYIEVNSIHKSLADTYRDDFSKYARHKALALYQRIFAVSPRLIGKRVKYSELSRDDRSADVRRAVDSLCLARLLAKVVHSDCSGLPVEAGSKDDMFKLIALDIGIATHMLGLNWSFMASAPERELINEGPMAEQFVGQHLLDAAALDSAAARLHFWMRDGRSCNAEVDYVIQFDGAIYPVEVKAGTAGGMKSLHQFVHERRPPLAIRFDMNRPSVQDIRCRLTTGAGEVVYRLLSLPVYAVEELPRILCDSKK